MSWRGISHLAQACFAPLDLEAGLEMTVHFRGISHPAQACFAPLDLEAGFEMTGAFQGDFSSRAGLLCVIRP